MPISKPLGSVGLRRLITSTKPVDTPRSETTSFHPDEPSSLDVDVHPFVAVFRLIHDKTRSNRVVARIWRLVSAMQIGDSDVTTSVDRLPTVGTEAGVRNGKPSDTGPSRVPSAEHRGVAENRGVSRRERPGLPARDYKLW